MILIIVILIFISLFSLIITKVSYTVSNRFAHEEGGARLINESNTGADCTQHIKMLIITDNIK